jgi:glycosyltransferase involved in cell wall biosynthesis
MVLAQPLDSLVSIGLPVRNGIETLESVARSVLAQDHENLELVISDNCSTDGTEDLCRQLAASDRRVVYFRQPTNIGLLKNFVHVTRLAQGAFLRWIGDDDWLAPNYVSRCLELFTDDSRLTLVTTQIEYVRPDGTTYTLPYSDSTFRSDDPIERFEGLLAHLRNGSFAVDPLYGLARRNSLAGIERRKTIREDEVFAAALALAGPWGHVPEVLARRTVSNLSHPALARRLGAPVWHAYIPTTVQSWELLRMLRGQDMTPQQRRRAQVAVGRFYFSQSSRTLRQRVGRLMKLVSQGRGDSK